MICSLSPFIFRAMGVPTGAESLLSSKPKRPARGILLVSAMLLLRMVQSPLRRMSSSPLLFGLIAKTFADVVNSDPAPPLSGANAIPLQTFRCALDSPVHAPLLTGANAIPLNEPRRSVFLRLQTRDGRNVHGGPTTQSSDDCIGDRPQSPGTLLSEMLIHWSLQGILQKANQMPGVPQLGSRYSKWPLGQNFQTAIGYQQQ